MSFVMSGCLPVGLNRENNEEGGKLSAIIKSIFGEKEKTPETDGESLGDILEGTWIRGDRSSMYGAKLEISFDGNGGKGVLRAVPGNLFGQVEGDIKWNNIIFTGEDSFEFSELSETPGQSKYVPAEATLDREDMTISVKVSENTGTTYQLWIKSGYMEEVQLPEEEPESDFLFPSNEKLITEADLDKHTKEEVAIIRNEIYARHGYIFKTEPFITYFNGKSWYVKNENFHEGMLNDIERANREFIVAYESKRGWR